MPRPTPENESQERTQAELDLPQDLDSEKVTELLQLECQVWQRRLRLLDWNIEVKVKRFTEMPSEALAAIQTFEERKDAFLYLLSPVDIELVQDRFLGNEAANYSLSIVHELLHLQLLPLSDYDVEHKRVAEEQIVNTLSRVLVQSHTSTTPPVVPPTTSSSSGHYL